MDLSRGRLGSLSTLYVRGIAGSSSERSRIYTLAVANSHQSTRLDPCTNLSVNELQVIESAKRGGCSYRISLLTSRHRSDMNVFLRKGSRGRVETGLEEKA